MKATIAKKIVFPFFVILILFIGMIGINYQGFTKVADALNNIELENIKHNDAGNLRFGITQLLMPANDFIITGHNRYKNEFDSLLQIVTKNLTAFSHRSLTKNEQQVLIQIKNDLDSITSYSKQVFSIPEPRKSLLAAQLMEIMDYRFGAEVNKKTTLIFDGISKRVEEYRLQTADVKENAAKALFGGTLISILIGIIVAFFSVRRISRPIISVAKAADCIAHGDYSCRPIPKTNDEIALLANSFNKMAASIQRSQKEQAEFKTILYSIGDGVITTNNAGVVKLMNLVAERLTGLSESDAKGRLLEDIIQIVNEETQKKVENPVEKVLSVGMVVGLANHTFLISKDGKEIPIAVNGAPIRDGQGEIEGVVLIFRDKTEEHKTEKLIRQSEARLKRAEFVSKTGNWELHLDTKTIIASEGAAKIYGVRGSKFDYSSIKQFPLPEYRPLLDEGLRSLIENDMPYDVEFKIKNPETGEIVHLHSVAEYDKENKIIFGVIQDITENKKAEAAIRESEERFRNLVENITDVFYIADVRGKMKYCSPNFFLFTGFTPQEILNQSYVRVVAPVDQRRVVEHYIGAERSGILDTRIELRVKRKDGSIFWAEQNTRFVRDENGNILEYRTVARDISERKKAEETIRASEERFRSVTQSANDAIISADSKGIIIEWNLSAEKIFGYAKEMIIGENLEIIIPQSYRDLHNIQLERTSLGGEHHIIGKTVEMYGLHISGREFPIELSLAEWQTSKGKFFSGIIRDISERKKAEAEAKAEHEKQREILEKLNALSDLMGKDITLEQSLDKGLQIIISTSFLRLKQMGAVFLVSIKNKELALKCHFNLAPPLQTMCALVPFGHCLCGRAALTGEIQYANCIDDRHDNQYSEIKPHGHYNIPIISDDELLGVIVLYLPDGHPYNSLEVSFLQSTADIFSAIITRKRTEKEIKSKNEQLQKADSEKDKFFSIIAHDLRSPFSGFLNLTEIMANEHEDFSKVELVEFGKSLFESASTVYKLLENLLEWAQMQKGTISFTPGELLLFKAVSSSINTIKQRALQKGISIINEVYDTQKVYADEKMINTILRNFLSNAVKFTRQGGQIIIRTKKLDDEMVEVSVSDTGVGMAEKDVNKLFKMEEKVSSKGTDGEPSTGLGLLLCKEFIEKNGGKVRVESEKGKGSIFYFTVPESNDKNN